MEDSEGEVETTISIHEIDFVEVDRDNNMPFLLFCCHQFRNQTCA